MGRRISMMKVLAFVCVVAMLLGNGEAYQACQSTNQPDVLLVVEDSNKLDSSSELQLRSFLAEIANNYKLETDAARVGYQLYNNTQRVVFNLNKFDQTNDARSIILTTTFTRGDVVPTIADALTYTWTNMLTVTNGERSCHPTVVILVSYSSYNDPNGDVAAPDPALIAKDLTAVRQLKNSGALIITVGVGKERNPKHLLELASGPEYYHDYAKFDLLTGTEADAIAVQACNYVPDGNFYPCEMRVVQADFVFVVDVSANFANHPEYRAAVVQFMNHTLSPYTYNHLTGVQAALVTYQKDADVQINFNDHNDLTSFLSDADAALQRSCGQYTQRCVDDALDKITSHVLTTTASPATGYRQTCTIHQIYIFTSDCFNCADPVPLANNLRTSTTTPNTQIYVVPLAYPTPGFWKEYLEIADDASHLWEAHPDPTPIVTEYLHKQAWRSVCRAFSTAQCPFSTSTSTAATTTASTPSTTAATTAAPAPVRAFKSHGGRPIVRY